MAKHASLTPHSFDLKSAQATVTVEAAFSKHRRRYVLPLHPELVLMLKDWLKGVGRDKYLFPDLGQKKTWLIVKKGLERVGIEYETPEGIADFHAAGRHTHITELLRNGTSLPEAKELARHRDIKMTMRYTHIGMEDQAKATKNLPWQAADGAKPQASDEPTEEEAWERLGSESAVCGCHQAAVGDPTHSPSLNDKTPAIAGVVATSRRLTPIVKKWRRRESNACPAERNQLAPHDVTTTAVSLSGDCQDFVCARCHQLAEDDNRLDVSLEAYDQDRSKIGKVAWQLAQQCRSIVQAYLREEEWQDADRAFCDVIRQGICGGLRHGTSESVT